MAHLRVLPVIKPKPKPDYGKIYRRIFHEKLAAAGHSWIIDLHKQIVFYGIKSVWYEGRTLKDIIPSEDYLQHLFERTLYIDHLIGKLTPAEFITIYPVRKTYDGHKWETKDYFYTMAELEKIGMNNPIGDRVTELFWDYQNWDVTRYHLTKMEVVSGLRRYQGHKSLMEEFLEDHGITPVRLMTDKKTGKQFLYDGKNQTTIPVSENKPRKPKWIKAV